jgi:uncharacterized protein YoxC
MLPHWRAAVRRRQIREYMSSELLPLPEIWSDPPKGDVPQSVRADIVANGRSGLVLIEYTSGFAQPDPQPDVRPPDSAEQAAASGHIPSFAAAALAKGLSDLSAIVTQAEALLRAQGALKGDVHFAVERIHDVALALRMRDVNAALCDTLDASVREVGDAVVRHEAAATGALSAAALLRDILNRIEDLTRVASGMVAPGTEPLAEAPGGAEDAVVVAAPARAATDAKALVPALAFAPPHADVAVEMPLPVIREAEPSIETPTPVPIAIEAQGAVEAPAAAGEAWPGPVAAQPAGFATRPQAYSASVPEADKMENTDPPVTPAIDAMTVDDVTSTSRVSDDVMPGGGVSDGHHAHAPLNDASDGLVAGNDLSQQPQPIAEPNNDRAAATAQSSASMPQPQDEITIADRIDGADEIDAAAGIKGAAEIDVADAIDVALDSVAGEIARDPDYAAGAPPALEAAIAVVHVESGEADSRQAAPSVLANESAITAEISPRRPVNDPLAAFYGLSEAELIALFS